MVDRCASLVAALMFDFCVLRVACRALFVARIVVVVCALCLIVVNCVHVFLCLVFVVVCVGVSCVVVVVWYLLCVDWWWLFGVRVLWCVYV